MKRRDKEKRTLREDWGLVMRGLKIWNELLPGYFACQVLCISAETFLPYFGLYMSAQLLNELAGGCRRWHLLALAAISVGGGFILSTITRILRGKVNVLGGNTMEQHEEYIMNEQNKHQYEHLENPDIVLLRYKIQTDFFSFGGGLQSMLWWFPGMVTNLFNVVFSASLTISMFTSSAEGTYTGFLGFVNSPLSVAVVVLLIVCSTCLSVRISAVKTQKSREALDGLSENNTYMRIYGGLWSMDMAVFNLHRIVLGQARKYFVHPAWVSKREKVEIKYGALSLILEAALNIAIFLFVAAKAFIGVFGIGSFILYQGTVGRFISAVSELAAGIGNLRYNNRFLVQLFSYLDLPNKMYQGTLAVEKRDDIDYEVEFRDVSFKYPRTDNWVLRHVDIKFKIGDKLAIVGENGSGKTTFIKLLCRLYDPTEGKILLNGIDITRYRYDEYMALFSVVFQDYTLFSFPLGETVAAGLSYDSEKVRGCLGRVGMGEKLAELDAAEGTGDGIDAKQADASKNGMDKKADVKNWKLPGARKIHGQDALTRAIGRDYDSEGVDFSGGERQKIALARALYKDAPFVILDEPTAALDPLAEAAVYETFNQIVKNKTSVFISHRLSSCRFCDMVAVFDHGQIVQKGTHDELAAAGGKYSQLWNAQAKYYE